MKCENLQLNLPIYLDDVLSERERAAVDAHLAKCPVCRQKAFDFQTLRRRLNDLSYPAISDELTNVVRRSVARQANSKEHPWMTEDFRRWLQMRVMPYSVGAFASLVFGTALLWALLSSANNPQNYELAKYEPSKTVMLTKPDSAVSYGDSDLTPADFAAARVSVSGDSPSINPQGALVALTKSIVRGKMKDDEVVVVADVFGSGLAQIAEVVEPSKNRRAVRELEKALKNNPDFAPPFVTANLDQRSDSVRVILKIQRVNVNTHLDR